jgi:hypothetical protein
MQHVAPAHPQADGQTSSNIAKHVPVYTSIACATRYAGVDILHEHVKMRVQSLLSGGSPAPERVARRTNTACCAHVVAQHCVETSQQLLHLYIAATTTRWRCTTLIWCTCRRNCAHNRSPACRKGHRLCRCRCHAEVRSCITRGVPQRCGKRVSARGRARCHAVS